MSDSVALTALVVSLVALFATIGQLLQQYFATADGYRRCQSSVMGLWAEKTRLRWRWKEFRFETIFVIPRITYSPIRPDMTNMYSELSCSLTGTEESMRVSLTLPGWDSPQARAYYDSDELARWVPLLAQLHRQGKVIIEYFPQSPSAVANDTTVPTVQFITKSWDFMTPEVVRPMASSTVSDVAIMARRLGMIWKAFDPSSGSMRAEGNGHVFTSTLVRSMGTVLEYTYPFRKHEIDCYYIPLKEADKLGFGLVELDHRLFEPHTGADLNVSSYEGLSKTLSLVMSPEILGSSRPLHRALRFISEAMKEGRDFIPGLNDLVPLCSAMLSNSSGPYAWLRRIPAPNLYSKGVTSSQEGFRVFKQRLESFISEKGNRATKQSIYILESIRDIEDRYGLKWEKEEMWDKWGLDINRERYGIDSHAERTAKSLIQRHHSEATDFLQQSRADYRELVGDHIFSATVPVKIPEVSSTLGPESTYDLEYNPELLSCMERYFDDLPSLVSRFYRRTKLRSPEHEITMADVEDAWLTMMFRGFCWQRSHVMIPGVPPLPSEFWDSKMPVYIG
ncbi:hypothetical protein B7494_g368 [Chlorociboria aeruginascens]|nr:hypothetical protein B7494_g368 [Chlorociboria aeruginascens]